MPAIEQSVTEEELGANLDRSRAIDARLISRLPRARTGFSYPAHLGGIRYDANGDIVVQRVPGRVRTAADAAFYTQAEAEGAIVVDVEFALIELEEKKARLLEDEEFRTSVNWVGMGIGVAVNRVVISIYPYNDESLERYRAQFDSGKLEFEPAAGPVTEIPVGPPLADEITFDGDSALIAPMNTIAVRPGSRISGCTENRPGFDAVPF